MTNDKMQKETQMAQFDLEYFFELSPDLLCIVGYDGYLKKINSAVAKTLGYRFEELFELPFNSFIHPEDRELSSRRQEEMRKGRPFFQFENRFIAKNGDEIWLLWTTVPIKRDQVIFCIAKDITARKAQENREHVSTVLANLNTEQMRRFSADIEIIKPSFVADSSNLKWIGSPSQLSQRDQIWLNQFEVLVRRFAEAQEISLNTLSNEMAISERQLFRQVKRIMGITPNKLVQTIRLHLAWEAITSRKYRTISEIANVAGYASKKHFVKLFNQVYGINVSDLL